MPAEKRKPEGATSAKASIIAKVPDMMKTLMKNIMPAMFQQFKEKLNKIVTSFPQYSSS